MSNQYIVSDINEAVSVIETYNLAGLIWQFDQCPLEEIKNHYVKKGDEEFVLVEVKVYEGFLPFRLVHVALRPFEFLDAEEYITTLSFHPNYNIYIVHEVKEED